MGEFGGLICSAVIFAFLLSLGLFVGAVIERNHFHNLADREQQLQDMLVTQLKSFPEHTIGEPHPTMLVSEVVISSDYLKSFLGALRNIFGGEVRSFQTLLERARREAVLRIQEQARQLGYNAVCNLRLETADIAGRGSNQKNKIVLVAILASGTAYHAKLD